jgi:hypothetical protein
MDVAEVPTSGIRRVDPIGAGDNDRYDGCTRSQRDTPDAGLAAVQATVA